MWHDEKLIWNPENYDEIDTLHIFHREVWQPDLVLYNAVGDTREILGTSYMVANYKGTIAWNPALNLQAWCDSTDMGKWPNDVHKCSIFLGFSRDFNHIKLKFNSNESSLVYHDSTQWSVTGADIISDISVYNQTSEPAILQLTFSLKRTSNLQEIIFFSPFIMISISLLSTFWMDPFGKTKISLTCSQLVLTTFLLLVLAMVIPSHTQHIPYLVTLYSFTMVAAVIALMIAIIVVNLSRNKKNTSVPLMLSKVLTCGAVSTGLLLPKMTTFEEYGKLNERTSTKFQEQNQMMWILLSLAIDRISFIVYLALVIFAAYSKP